MEEKKPLESRSLTHTSKEPEGQVWAQIGTTAYDPPIKSEPNGLLGDGGKQQSINASKPIDGEAGDLELQVDVKDEPLQAEATEKEAECNKSDIPEVKKNTLGDGFDTELHSNITSKKKEERSRSRSRSRSRERKKDDSFSRDRTNSHDPRQIRSRVFVGHLNTSECKKDMLEKLFAPYGKITGVNVQNGYGFVQFEEEDSVKAAIKELHGTTFCGTKIVVDRPVALRKMEEERERGRDRDLIEELELLRRRELYDRYARLEEMERYYHERDRRDRHHYGDFTDRDRYWNKGMHDRYRNDLYDYPSYNRRDGHYMGRDDPYYGMPPSRRM